MTWNNAGTITATHSFYLVNWESYRGFGLWSNNHVNKEKYHSKNMRVYGFMRQTKRNGTVMRNKEHILLAFFVNYSIKPLKTHTS